MPNRNCLVSLAVALCLPACAGEMADGDVGADPGPAATPAPGAGDPDWVEELAPGVDPCEGATVTSCGAATHGACGVIAIDVGERCLPRFAWGVLPDGSVQFASSERRFSIADLARAPLSAVEDEEAQARADEIASAGPDEAVHEAEAGWITINHSGWCSVIASICDRSSTLSHYYKFSSHYNYMDGLTYRHRHVLRDNIGSGCAPSGWYGYVYVNCGTP